MKNIELWSKWRQIPATDPEIGLKGEKRIYFSISVKINNKEQIEAELKFARRPSKLTAAEKLPGKTT